MSKIINIIIAIVVFTILGIEIYFGVSSYSVAFELVNCVLVRMALFSFYIALPSLTIAILVILLKQRSCIKLLIFIISLVISYLALQAAQFATPSAGYEESFNTGLSFLVFLLVALMVVYKCTPLRYAVIAYSFFIILLVGPAFIAATMAYLYSPPAIKETDISIMEEWISYIQDNIKEPCVYYHQRYGFDNRCEIIGFTDFPDQHSAKLSSKMLEEGFMVVHKVGDMILFYKNVNVILAPGPGILYSPKSDNPNESQNEQIIKARPYEKISDNWYISKKLVLGGPRDTKQLIVPNSLIDKSLDIDEEVLNELIMFSEENKKALANTGN